MKSILKTGKRKFKVSTKNHPDGTIDLDFNPIISRFNLHKGRDDYKLIHWQGRPKGEREWGIYDPQADSYRCGVYALHHSFIGEMRLLMIEDNIATSLPSACLYYVGELPF